MISFKRHSRKCNNVKKVNGERVHTIPYHDTTYIPSIDITTKVRLIADRYDTYLHWKHGFLSTLYLRNEIFKT